MEGVGKLAQMPLDEWKSTLATIGGELIGQTTIWTGLKLLSPS